MKRIFVGGVGNCGVHNEKYMIDKIVSKSVKYGMVDDFRDADLIVIIDTCMATDYNIIASFEYLEKVLNEKKYNAELVVSGCLIKGCKFEHEMFNKNILNKFECVELDKIVEYVFNKVDGKMEENDDFELPYSVDGNSVFLSLVSGCLNNCNFCKVNFMNFPLKSISLDKIENFASNIDKFNYLEICSSNFSLYGVDLYGKQRSHEVIKILTSPSCVKFVSIGALINFYPELINEILNNPKIKTIFTSIESGSDRIYNLMNRPISLDELKKIIKLIRRERPDIIVNTEFICGYPTENKDDIKKTIDLVYELDVNPLYVHPYRNSLYVPSSKLEQYTFSKCLKKAHYMDNKLNGIRSKFEKFINTGEMYIINREEDYGIYECMMIDGNICFIPFNQLDREYFVGDIFIFDQVCKKRILKKK